jgi:hypothetical protein
MENRMVQRTAWAASDESPRRNSGGNTANSHLSHAWTKLFELCRENPYGQFHGLPFRDGEPVLTPKPKVIVTIKLGKDDGAPRSMDEIAGDGRSVRLRQQLARWRNGTIRRLTVNDGIPDVVDIEPEDQA